MSNQINAINISNVDISYTDMNEKSKFLEVLSN